MPRSCGRAAATVVSHGLCARLWSQPGPLLPAESATKMPASTPPWKACATESSDDGGASDREVDDVDTVNDRVVDRGEDGRVEATARVGLDPSKQTL